jgi:hypothetical protein
MPRPIRSARAAALLAAVCALALSPRPAAAAKFAGAFMERGGGARALALGGAFTAVADDASAVFWNPAGLSLAGTRSLLLMHEASFGGLVKRDFAAYAQPVTWSLLGGDEAGFGVAAIRLGVDDIPFTSHLFSQLDLDHNGVVSDIEAQRLFLPELQDQIRFKSDQEWALLVSYGERRGSWRFGGSLKLVHQSVGGYTSNGLGFDAAALRPGIWRRLDFGVKLQDVTTTYLSWSTGKNEVIAPAVVPALAWRQPLPGWDAGVLVAASLETRFENRGEADQFHAGALSANLHLGAELALRERVFLRGGFDSGFGSGDLTAGAGLRLDRFTVDYAYAGDTLDIDEVTHRVSLSARF